MNCFFLLCRIILHSLFLSFTNRGYQPKIIALRSYLRSGTSTFKIKHFKKAFGFFPKCKFLNTHVSYHINGGVGKKCASLELRSLYSRGQAWPLLFCNIINGLSGVSDYKCLSLCMHPYLALNLVLLLFQPKGVQIANTIHVCVSRGRNINSSLLFRHFFRYLSRCHLAKES